MKKKTVMMVILILMVFFCEPVAFGVVFPQTAEVLRKVVETSMTSAGCEETPTSGIPGGPPGTPG